MTPGGAQTNGTLIQSGSGNYVYEFQVKGPSTGNQWQILQALSPVPTYTWDTAGILGQHRVRVRLKNTGTDDKPVNRGRNMILQ